ncbi:hypothetical protein EDB86DRAFT_2832073 [Lactarius hatsudake]|nr:hypothetical protein EDB86DRAFT_2832073 [Lactarius hatsudake]
MSSTFIGSGTSRGHRALYGVSVPPLSIVLDRVRRQTCIPAGHRPLRSGTAKTDTPACLDPRANTSRITGNGPVTSVAVVIVASLRTRKLGLRQTAPSGRAGAQAGASLPRIDLTGRVGRFHYTWAGMMFNTFIAHTNTQAITAHLWNTRQRPSMADVRWLEALLGEAYGEIELVLVMVEGKIFDQVLTRQKVSGTDSLQNTSRNGRSPTQYNLNHATWAAETLCGAYSAATPATWLGDDTPWEVEFERPGPLRSSFDSITWLRASVCSSREDGVTTKTCCTTTLRWPLVYAAAHNTPPPLLPHNRKINRPPKANELVPGAYPRAERDVHLALVLRRQGMLAQAFWHRVTEGQPFDVQNDSRRDFLCEVIDAANKVSLWSREVYEKRLMNFKFAGGGGRTTDRKGTPGKPKAYTVSARSSLGSLTPLGFWAVTTFQSDPRPPLLRRGSYAP